jgi:chromosome segregation ATPase
MRIIDRLRYQALIKSLPTGTPPKENPLLKKQLDQVQKDLSSILNKWNWGGKKPKTSEEFINKFEPWIDERIKENKELTDFLKFHSVKNLTELETQWTNTEKDYLEQIRELKEKGTTELSEELKEKLENYDDLEIERDGLARDKKSLEQEVIALSNQVKLKNQENKSKDEENQRLKKENKDLKTKYDKKAQLLDQEQSEINRLENEIEKLNGKITTLENERKELLKNQK